MLPVALSLALSLLIPLAAPASRCRPGPELCLARVDPPLQSYRAIRTLSASNGRYKLTAWMEAWTEFEAGKGLRFGVTAEGGSGYIRSKVLRRALEAEAEAVAAGETSRAALTEANYAFGTPEPVAGGLLRITLTPRRKDRMLIDGAMFVTAADRDLVRVEGRLSKNPSFWTRRVDIVRTYGRIDGHRVALETTSSASVVMAGESSFTMRYQYEQINGSPVRVN